MDWQDRISAPKDGTAFLGFSECADGNAMNVVWFDDNAAAGFPWSTIDDDVSYPLAWLTHWMPLPAPPGSAPTPAAAEARATKATERDAKDFAVEFGGYLATSAEAFLNLLNRTRAIRVNLSGATTDAISDHFRGLHGAIYEFRNRADRILNPTPAADARATTAQIDAAIRAWEEFPADGIPSVRGALTPMGQRALQAALDAALSLPPPEAKEDDGPCFYCGQRTDSYAGDPGRWPLVFAQPDGTGIARHHHIRCITERLPEAKDGAAPSPETGWRLVPVEATDAMLHAPLENKLDIELDDGRILTGKRYESRRDLRPLIWAKMLAAAPAAPSPDLAALVEQCATALKPFADYAPSPWNVAPPDSMIVTAGSSMAKRQLTIGDLRRAHAAHSAILEAQPNAGPSADGGKAT